MEPGYGSIVGGGDNACILHYVENNMALNDGDLLLIDAGGELDGYTADITRTFPVSGKFSKAQRAVYEIVLAANKAAIKTLKVGESVGKPHEVATRILTEGRSEERRVGKEWVSTCRSRGSPYMLQKNNTHKKD